MRALLVVNPQATSTSLRSRDVLIRALGSEIDLEVAYTRRRGHATALARESAGAELVIAHGGDGTVNEVVNGLMATGSRAADRPALAVVPGGSTDVFARALGLPRDWAEAAAVILERLRDGQRRSIGLGRADERFFTFCAGLGLDAAVIRDVERARLQGRTSTPGLYLRATLRQLVSVRRGEPVITMETPQPSGSDAVAAEKLASVIIQNTAPWTYLGDRPIDPNPAASFDLGLDVLAMRALRVPSAARTFRQMWSRRGSPHGAQVARWHDLPELTLRATVPQPFQVDGDYLGERAKVQLIAVPRALRVLC